MPPLVLLTPTAPTPWTTAVLPAAIAACVSIIVVVIGHFTTRGRDHEGWLREQVFKATHTFSAATRKFHHHIFHSGPRMNADSATQQAAQFILDNHNWSTLSHHLGDTLDALTDLKMLLNDRTSRRYIEDAREQLRLAYGAARFPPGVEGTSGIIHASDFHGRFHDAYRTYLDTQKAFTEHIVSTHFATRRDRFRKRFWL